VAQTPAICAPHHRCAGGCHAGCDREVFVRPGLQTGARAALRKSPVRSVIAWHGIPQIVRPVRIGRSIRLLGVVARNIRVGDARISIAFTRRLDGTTSHEVLDKTGSLRVLHVAPPQDAEPSKTSWRDALTGWFLEHAPGRVAMALRLALADDS